MPALIIVIIMLYGSYSLSSCSSSSPYDRSAVDERMRAQEFLNNNAPRDNLGPFDKSCGPGTQCERDVRALQGIR